MAQVPPSTAATPNPNLYVYSNPNLSIQPGFALVSIEALTAINKLGHEIKGKSELTQEDCDFDVKDQYFSEKSAQLVSITQGILNVPSTAPNPDTVENTPDKEPQINTVKEDLKKYYRAEFDIISKKVDILSKDFPKADSDTSKNANLTTLIKLSEQSDEIYYSLLKLDKKEVTTLCQHMNPAETEMLIKHAHMNASKYDKLANLKVSSSTNKDEKEVKAKKEKKEVKEKFEKKWQENINELINIQKNAQSLFNIPACNETFTNAVTKADKQLSHEFYQLVSELVKIVRESSPQICKFAYAVQEDRNLTIKQKKNWDQAQTSHKTIVEKGLETSQEKFESYDTVSSKHHAIFKILVNFLNRMRTKKEDDTYVYFDPLLSPSQQYLKPYVIARREALCKDIDEALTSLKNAYESKSGKTQGLVNETNLYCKYAEEQSVDYKCLTSSGNFLTNAISQMLKVKPIDTWESKTSLHRYSPFDPRFISKDVDIYKEYNLKKLLRNETKDPIRDTYTSLVEKTDKYLTVDDWNKINKKLEELHKGIPIIDQYNKDIQEARSQLQNNKNLKQFYDDLGSKGLNTPKGKYDSYDQFASYYSAAYKYCESMITKLKSQLTLEPHEEFLTTGIVERRNMILIQLNQVGVLIIDAMKNLTDQINNEYKGKRHYITDVNFKPATEVNVFSATQPKFTEYKKE